MQLYLLDDQVCHVMICFVNFPLLTFKSVRAGIFIVDQFKYIHRIIPVFFDIIDCPGSACFLLQATVPFQGDILINL